MTTEFMPAYMVRVGDTIFHEDYPATVVRTERNSAGVVRLVWGDDVREQAYVSTKTQVLVGLTQ
jgi:hypothetical protein